MIGFLRDILQKIGRLGDKANISTAQIRYYSALVKLNEEDTSEWQEIKEQYLRDFAKQLSMAMQNADVNPKLAVESLLMARIYHDLIYTAQNAGDLKKEVVAKTAQQKIQNEAAKNLFKE